MRLSSRTRKTFLTFTLLGLGVGTLAWEVLERVLSLANVELSVAVGPIGFDVEVLELYVMVNPGTLLGVLLAIALFRRS